MFAKFSCSVISHLLSNMSMTRHNLQSFLLLVTILGLCSGAFTNALTTINGTAQCKTTPDSPDWPSLSMWNNLNESVAGRLLQPSPPGAVCHPGQPTYDADLCPAVQAGWLTYDWHSRDPVSTDWNNWNNDTCLPDASYPCSGQSPFAKRHHFLFVRRRVWLM